MENFIGVKDNSVKDVKSTEEFDQAISDRKVIRDMNKEDIMEYFDEYEKSWVSPLDSKDFLKCGLKCLDINERTLVDGLLTPDVLYDHYQNAIHISTEINMQLYRTEILHDEELSSEYKRRIHRIWEIIYYTYNMLQSVVHVHCCKNPDIDNTSDTELGFFRFKCVADCRNTPFQNLILYILEYMNMRNLRKYKDKCMKKVYSPDGKFTYSWTIHCTLIDVVYEACRKETNYDQWQNMTAAKDNPTKVAEYIQNCHDPEVPALFKNRNMHSFTNGVYFSDRDEFVTYASGKIDPGKECSSKFFNNKFTEYPSDTHWSDIPTPYLEHIMDFQEWSEEVKKWMYVFIGRCLYDLGHKDDWQVVFFLEGIAGSGKSTIINSIIKLLYDDDDVGTMSTNIEKKFGVEALTEKYVIVAPEIKHDVCIEQADFQSMVSGERVVANRKNRQPIVVDPWKAPIAMAGNQVPNWSDNSNSIARRIVWFYFSMIVPTDKGDMKMGKKLEAELPNIIQKSNKAYLEATDKFSNDNIWRHLPQYFHDQRSEMAKSCNPLHAFMTSELIEYGSDMWVEEEVFKAAFKLFVSDNGHKPTKWGKDLYASLFQVHSLAIETPKARSGTRVNASGKKVKGNVIQGCRLKIISEEEED